jgi:hypothetical protein
LSSAEHAEHLAQVRVADRALAPVRLADPVEQRRQRARRVEVVGQRVEERVAQRRELLGDSPAQPPPGVADPLDAAARASSRSRV